MPCSPSSPRRGHSWRGNLFDRSISSAIGAIWSAAKERTVSRIMSAVSPRPKSKSGDWLGSIVASSAQVPDHTAPPSVLQPLDLHEGEECGGDQSFQAPADRRDLRLAHCQRAPRLDGAPPRDELLAARR